MHDKPPIGLGSRLGGATLLAGTFLILTACASSPPAPTGSLQSASSAISNAERANAGRFAAADLAQAREKYAQSNSAVEDKQMVVAEQLAEEARVSADLAFARTEAAKAAAVNKEMKLGAEALTEEMQRAGEQP